MWKKEETCRSWVEERRKKEETATEGGEEGRNVPHFFAPPPLLVFVFLSVFLTLMEEGNQAVASAVGYGEHGMHDIIASKEKYLRKKTRRKDYSISVMQQIHIAHTPHTTHGT